MTDPHNLYAHLGSVPEEEGPKLQPPGDAPRLPEQRHPQPETIQAGEYGDAVIIRHLDGRHQVARADRLIGVHMEVFMSAEKWVFGPDGTFWLDPLGEYRYRPVRFEPAEAILVLEQVRAPERLPQG